jgi:hypothetical protein
MTFGYYSTSPLKKCFWKNYECHWLCQCRKIVVFLALAEPVAHFFNKLRMCVFPKWYIYNKIDPPVWPFEGTPPNKWDFSRPNPAFFRNFEKRVSPLCDLSIQADVILFHPYDTGHWGFDHMGADSDDRYLRYVVSRLAAYRSDGVILRPSAWSACFGSRLSAARIAGTARRILIPATCRGGEIILVLGIKDTVELRSAA